MSCDKMVTHVGMLLHNSHKRFASYQYDHLTKLIRHHEFRQTWVEIHILSKLQKNYQLSKSTGWLMFSHFLSREFPQGL